MVALFSETAGRFVISVAPDDAAALAAELPDGSWADVGDVVSELQLTVRRDGADLLSVGLEELLRAWQTPI